LRLEVDTLRTQHLKRVSDWKERKIADDKQERAADAEYLQLTKETLGLMRAINGHMNAGSGSVAPYVNHGSISDQNLHRYRIVRNSAVIKGGK
jgi:hypothetical protein